MRKNNSLYFQKIYAINSEEEENKAKNESLDRKRKIKERKKKINSLSKVFKPPQNNNKNISRWHKITHPKLPFSNVRKEDPEIIKKKIELLRPSRLYHDFHTIQWLRKKYSDSVIEKSVFSILPEKGKSKKKINESEAQKRQRKMIEYLESSKGPFGKEKYVKINPKYFYNQTAYDKIQKLKEIFLEFDGGGHRKMEMNELINLFSQNNIRADIKELINLFFKDRKVKKEDYMKLYLNFYQFLTFALTKEQDFRQFMRKIKEKYNKNDDEQKKDKDSYFPMNLNLVLDYFINKGKERSSIEKIENAINEMDDIIRETTLLPEKVSKKDLLSDLEENSKRHKKNKNIKFHENSDGRRQSNRELSKSIGHYILSEDKEKKIVSSSNLKFKRIEKEEIEKRFERIDFKELIKEFSNLFNYNGLNGTDNKGKHKLFKIKQSKRNNFTTRVNNFNKMRRKSQEIKSLSSMNIFSPLNKNKSNIINFNNTKMINNLNSSALNEFMENESSIGNAVKQKMNNHSILNMNVQNYEKLHDIRLAINATKEQMKHIKNNNINESYRYVNKMKKCSSQRCLPEITLLKNLNNKEYVYNIKKNDISKHLTYSKTNNIKRSEQTIISNKSNINNYMSETNNNYSKLYKTNKTNRTFLNVFCGKSQLINMSQEQTDFYSKSKFDYVPPELLSTPKEM